MDVFFVGEVFYKREYLINAIVVVRGGNWRICARILVMDILCLHSEDSIFHLCVDGFFDLVMNPD